MSEVQPPLSPTAVREAQIGETDSLTKAIQKRIYGNYKRIAYILVLGTYFVAFGEYIYLRLTSIILPEKFVYKRPCELLHGEIIIRSFWHYGSALLCFVVIGFMQLVCFFMLTVSRNYTHFRRRYENYISMEEKLCKEMVIHIKTVMYNTCIPAFLVYSMTSIVVFAGIFYMVGMRDEIIDTTSRIFIYCFDGTMLLYFVAFPVVTIIYHPDILCSVKRCFTIPDDNPAIPFNITSAHLTAYKLADDDIRQPENLRVRITTTV